MFVYVLNKNGKPLMPTNPAKARILLKTNRAKVMKTTPITIKILYGSEEYTQPIIAGMDTGSKHIGCAAVSNNQVVYQSEIEIRDDISKKMKTRSSYRRTRRSRKTRYRPARFNNRHNSKKLDRIAPSIRSKIESHLREKSFVESILPITKWIVELASFDIHKITNPNVSGTGSQNGPMKNLYNAKAYVLSRDGYTCQHCKGKSKDRKLDCHHIIFRSNRGTDTPDNLITLCRTCHDELHAGKFKITGSPSKTKHATEIGIIKSQLKKSSWEFDETFGYESKFKREQILKLPKTHYNDAVARYAALTINMFNWMIQYISKDMLVREITSKPKANDPKNQYQLVKYSELENSTKYELKKEKDSYGVECPKDTEYCVTSTGTRQLQVSLSKRTVPD